MEFHDLNERQKEAVEYVDGPMMILAGAGSGKTKTLVSKIAYLVDQQRIPLYKILALTFSNKAAREMRERLSMTLQMPAEAFYQVTTFHSFAARVLRKEYGHLGLGRNFTIYDQREAKIVAKSILEKKGISQKDVSPASLQYFIDDLKNKGMYKGREKYIDKDLWDREYECFAQDELYPLFLAYEMELHKSNALDFGGLITASLQLFEGFPNVLDYYRNRFDYILVDEYQDTNKAQFDLVSHITSGDTKICVVGDEDQSIYSWRGADIRNILDFELSYPGHTLIKLEQNYRSTRNIIEAASHVISKNNARKGKILWTENPEGESIKILECETEKDEAKFLVTKIGELREKDIPYGDMAVFYRANSQSRLIEDELRKEKVPYRIIGGIKFYDRKEIKDITAYLRLIVNPDDSLALSRIINVPARGIGVTSLRRIEQYAQENMNSLWHVLVQVGEGNFSKEQISLTNKVKSSISAFVLLVKEARNQLDQGVLPSSVFELLMKNSGLIDSLKASRDYDAQSRLENIEEFYNAIKQYEGQSKSPSLSNFLESVVLDNSREGSNGEEIGLSLMTIHGAKGLEFPYVFLAGVEENIFPSRKSVDAGEMGVEEERRLFYVAMTRAMQELYISFAQSRVVFGQVQFHGPGQFIYEIPESYYTWESWKDSSNYDNYSTYTKPYTKKQSKNFSVKSKVLPSNYTSDRVYNKGQKVRHSLYGMGTIKESSGSGHDETVTIEFYDGAKKKFKVSYAPLSLVD